MPDSSLRVILCFFSCRHSDSARRSRMTAELFLFCHDVLTCVRKHAPIASQARHFPPSSGEADTKEERIHSFYYLNTLLTITYAGFFAKSHMMFFLLSSFRFCPPLKNDGRGELCFLMVLTACLSFLNEGKMRSGVEK